MVTKVQATGVTITDLTQLQTFCDAIADAVVSHITSSAVVSVTTSTPGATAGPTALGGTGSGTVS